jgi:DNA-binding transcriptional regulator YiaG
MRRTSEATVKAKEKRFDQDHQELLPKLMDHFHNNKDELAVALGLSASTVERWFSGKSRPNNSTVLRMRSLAQERGIR